MRVTSADAFFWRPVWSPDGQRLFYSSVESGPHIHVHSKAADGTGTFHQLTDSTSGQIMNSYSAVHHALFFNDCLRPGICDIGMQPMAVSSEVSLLVQEDYYVGEPSVSPNGRWLAFNSAETGSLEIYVHPFPDVDARSWQVSTQGGRYPTWSHDGRELFYWNVSGSDRGLMTVPIDDESDFDYGEPTLLYRSSWKSATRSLYDAAPEADRFVIVKPMMESKPEMVVVLNWLEELERLVPRIE